MAGNNNNNNDNGIKRGKGINKRPDIDAKILDGTGRYQVVIYSSGKQPKVGETHSVDEGKLGTVIAVNYPTKDRAVIDMDVGRAVINGMGAKFKSQLNSIDLFLDFLGSLRIRKLLDSSNEILSSDKTSPQSLRIMEWENLSCSIIGANSGECFDKLGQLIDNGIHRFNKAAKKCQLQEYVNQLQ